MRKITWEWANDNTGVSILFSFTAIKQLSFVSILTVNCPGRDVFASTRSEWSHVPSHRLRGSSQHAVRSSTAGEERRRRVTARGVHLGTWSTNPLSMSPVRAQPPLCFPCVVLAVIVVRASPPPATFVQRLVCPQERASEKKNPR